MYYYRMCLERLQTYVPEVPALNLSRCVGHLYMIFVSVSKKILG